MVNDDLFLGNVFFFGLGLVSIGCPFQMTSSQMFEKGAGAVRTGMKRGACSTCRGTAMKAEISPFADMGLLVGGLVAIFYFPIYWE